MSDLDLQDCRIILQTVGVVLKRDSISSATSVTMEPFKGTKNKNEVLKKVVEMMKEICYVTVQELTKEKYKEIYGYFAYNRFFVYNGE